MCQLTTLYYTDYTVLMIIMIIHVQQLLAMEGQKHNIEEACMCRCCQQRRISGKMTFIRNLSIYKNRFSSPSYVDHSSYSTLKMMLQLLATNHVFTKRVQLRIAIQCSYKGIPKCNSINMYLLQKIKSSVDSLEALHM